MKTQLETHLTLNDLLCTTKAQQSIQNFTNDLTGRERQLLILMTRHSNLCHRACESLLAKINIASLIERGYLIHLVQSDGLENEFETASVTMPVSDHQEEPEAILRFSAGNF